MAHNLFGTRYFGRQAAWHEIGTVKNVRVTASEAVDLANLDYRVTKQPLRVEVAGTWIEVPDKVALVREPTADDPQHQVFGVVSPSYTILQNRDIFQALDPISELWPVETAGALANGAKAFMSLSLGDAEVTDQDGRKDPIQLYFLVVEDKTGSGALSIRYTPIRVVCQNTLTLSAKNFTINTDIRHKGNTMLEYRTRMELMARMQGVSQKALDLFGQMAKTAIEQSDWVSILDAAYPLPKKAKKLELMEMLAPQDEQAAPDPLYEALRTVEERHEYVTGRVEQYREAATELYQLFNDTQPAPNTAWAAYQAVVETEDYRRGGNAAEAALFSHRAAAKSRAFDAAVKLCLN